MNNMTRRKALQTIGKGSLAAGALFIPGLVRASTKYQVKCVTSWPTSAGATAQASSNWASSYPIASINNGDRIGQPALNMIWRDTTADVYPDWVEIDFNGVKTIDHVVVYTTQDGPTYVEPTDTMTSSAGITGFDVVCWNGGTWITVGSVTGNNLVKRRVDFAAFQTTKIRINITGGHTYSRIVEVEAFSTDTSGSGGSPPYNVALAAPAPVVSGLDVVYSSLAKATGAKSDFAHYSDSVLTPIFTNLGLTNPTCEYSILTTTNQVTTSPQTIGLAYAVNTGTQDPNTALASVNGLPASAVDPHNMQAQELGLLVVEGLIFFGAASLYLIGYTAVQYFQSQSLATQPYWGWEGNASNNKPTWEQTGGGGAPVWVPD
jgi:hypothetical protein